MATGWRQGRHKDGGVETREKPILVGVRVIILQRGSNSGILLGENINDRHSTYDVTLKRVGAIIVSVEKQ